MIPISSILYPMSRPYTQLTSHAKVSGLILSGDTYGSMSESDPDTRNPNDLDRHPLNQDVYGDLTLEPDFIESVKQHGVLEPILINSGDTIISGHRRHAAAIEVDLDEVPIREVSFDSELEEREAVIHHNKQRTKTFSQKMREAMELENIEKERANQRQGARTDIKQTFAASEFGQTRDKVAGDLEMSHETYRQAKKVWQAKEENIEIAVQAVEKIDNGSQSIHGAYKELRRWEQIRELEGAVDWKDIRNSGTDKIGQQKGTFSDSKATLSDSNDWTDSLNELIEEYESRWGGYEQGDVFVFSYMLEDAGFAEFSGVDSEPDSFSERKPDHDTLFNLYWEDGRELTELAVRFGVDTALIKYWMYELDIPLRKQDLTQAQQDEI